AEEAEATKANLGIDWPAFTVPEDVLEHTRAVLRRGAEAREHWEASFDRYAHEFPAEAEELKAVFSGAAPDLSGLSLPSFEVGGKVATRKASAAALNAVAAVVPGMV